MTPVAHGRNLVGSLRRDSFNRKIAHVMDFDGGLGGEAEETALFLPVIRQVFAQAQQRGQRLLNGMSTCE